MFFDRLRLAETLQIAFLFDQHYSSSNDPHLCPKVTMSIPDVNMTERVLWAFKTSVLQEGSRRK